MTQETQTVNQAEQTTDAAVGNNIELQQDMVDELLKQQAGEAADNAAQKPAPETPVQEQPVESFQEPTLSEITSDGSKININMLVDVPVRVTAELGRTRMTVKQILDLERGSVIELDRIAGDPIDLFVNDHLIARGEVVIVDDNFGIRITEILASPPITGIE